MPYEAVSPRRMNLARRANATTMMTPVALFFTQQSRRACDDADFQKNDAIPWNVSHFYHRLLWLIAFGDIHNKNSAVDFFSKSRLDEREESSIFPPFPTQKRKRIYE
ncbi:MAG: hypothetical protein JXR23_02480 [Pontiellaceae bacterium]|nr:hypothetical protein [Pontiellaceae bacterium]